MNVEGQLQESGQQNLPHYIASIPHTIPSAKACNTEHASKSCRLIQNIWFEIPSTRNVEEPSGATTAHA